MNTFVAVLHTIQTNKPYFGVAALKYNVNINLVFTIPKISQIF